MDYDELVSRVNLSSEAGPWADGLLGVERDESNEEDEGCWGETEADAYFDHGAICDKQNRFQALSTPSSPREDGNEYNTSMVAPLPEQVTDTGRMVNHILTSCLKKRKLHLPYKDRVKLVNFTPVVAKTTPMTVVQPIRTIAVPPIVKVLDDDENQDMNDKEDSVGGPFITSNQTPTMSKVRDGAKDSIQPPDEEGKKIETPKKLPSPVLGTSLTKKVAQEKRKHALMSMPLVLTNLKVSPMPSSSPISSEDISDVDMLVDQELLELGNSITASTSRILRPKVDYMPLPELGAMPQDLRELKLKIEATENKVEGTKHRHRKGGPCPRCQVQNQLRAAKRALLCRMKRYK